MTIAATLTAVTESDADRADLLAFLAAQRESVLAIVAGLDETLLRTPVVPSGWTPLGLVEHLGHVERFWFQEVVRGYMDALPWAEEDSDGPHTSQHPTEDVFAFYREQCVRSDAVLSATSLDAPPRGQVPADMAELGRTVRTIVLHMIEETARHAGHLDIARELLDGQTGLGPR